MRYLLILLLLASIPHTAAEPEITLSFLLPTGDPVQQTQAFFIKESLKHIGINVELNYISPELYDDYVKGKSFAASVTSHDMLMYPISPWSDYFTQYDDERIQSMPDFTWAYDYTESDSSSLYKLRSNRPVFGSHTASEFIDMIQSMNKYPFSQYKVKLSEFQQYFMGELLFDIPMFREIEAVTIQMGFGDDLSYHWDPNVSMLDHLKEGFRWMRPNGTHTTIPGVVDNIMDVLEYQMDPLIYFDEEFIPHPAIAYQYVSGDFGETIIHDGVPTRVYRYSYYIPTDRYWSTGESLTSNDFALGLMYNPFGLDLTDYLDYEIGTTITTNDTFSIFVDLNNFNTFDFYDLGGLIPIPSSTFGDGLHDFFGETSRILESDEWGAYIENPSFVGPFEMVDQNSLKIRDDFYFPTESDVDTFYNEGFLEMEVLTNLNFSTFAPHTQTYPLYWQDQSELTIDFIEEDLASFLSGDLDIIYQGVEGFVTKEKFTRSFPTLLVFNLANNYLQDFKVRKAIAHAINREELQIIYPSVELAPSILAGPSHIFDEELSVPYSMNAAKLVLVGGSFIADNYSIPDSREQELPYLFPIIILPFIGRRKNISSLST